MAADKALVAIILFIVVLIIVIIISKYFYSGGKNIFEKGTPTNETIVNIISPSTVYEGFRRMKRSDTSISFIIILLLAVVIIIIAILLYLNIGKNVKGSKIVEFGENLTNKSPYA